jgi:hypothetical protein
VSGDISKTSTSLAATGAYYYASKAVAINIGLALKITNPDWFQMYESAFRAGAWLPHDPGPFLGRAIIYKLQGKLHKDRHDLGPSASFAVGNFSGGEMLFPQLRVKLQYV